MTYRLTRPRLLPYLLSAMTTLILALVVGTHLGHFPLVTDGGHYVNLAMGSRNVPQPFASRQLGPAVVRLCSHLFGWTVERSFILQGVVSLIVLVCGVYGLLVRSTVPSWLLLGLVALPFWPKLFSALLLPDLWYAALLVLFLWMLSRNYLLAASAMFFPLMLSRESTLLTLVCFLFVAFRRIPWSALFLSIASVIAGSMLVKHLTAGMPSNGEHLPQSLYMLAKVPWNFLRNILGIVPWSNVYPSLCTAPQWSHPFHLGPVTAIGICGFTPEAPFFLGYGAFTEFGLLPILFLFLWTKRNKFLGNDGEKRLGDLLLSFCLVYGVMSFLIAPLLGTGLDRLFSYGWPLFLVALPLLFGSHLLPSSAGKANQWIVLFVGLHLLSCAFISPERFHLVVIVQTALNIAGYLALRLWWKHRLPDPEPRSPSLEPAPASL